MLLEFKLKNYKSFKDEQIFSMLPAEKQKDLLYSILEEKTGTKVQKGLCSAVIYGPNASGKTNLLGAIDTLKNIVHRGSIKNGMTSPLSPNIAAYVLEFIPYRLNKEAKPVEFAIKFAHAGILFDYSLKMNIGAFLQSDCKRSVQEEQLCINNSKIYTRTRNNIEFGKFNAIKDNLNDGTKENDEQIIKIAVNSLRDEDLFLNNGFKSIFSAKIAEMIIDWFDNNLMVIYNADIARVRESFNMENNNAPYVKSETCEAAKIFGMTSNEIGYISTGSGKQKLCSIFEDKSGKLAAVNVEAYESYGTVQFINKFPLIVDAIKNGKTLIIDEFDASIHPMAIMNIIQLFHNDEINKKHAQLIFNTHNPIFLSNKLFRRDEIKFVEAETDGDCRSSVHYSLADFKTSGKSGVRKSEDYMKSYFVGRYGAIQNIDFSVLFSNSKEEHNG